MSSSYKSGFVRDDATGALIVTGVSTGAAAPLTLTGSTDAVQLLVKGNATQTNAVVKFQTSGGVDLFSIANDGSMTLGKNDGATAANITAVTDAGGSGQFKIGTNCILRAESSTASSLGGANQKSFRFDGFNSTLAFYGTAPVAKPTVTGSKGANAALTSLMAALVALGLVTDTTT